MDIRIIDAAEITASVKKLFMDMNYFIGSDILDALHQARENEVSETGKNVLDQIIENHKIASAEEVPICQDTGMAVLFVEYGEKVVIDNGSFEDAVQEGVRQAYIDGYLRKSVVSDPVFERINTKDNTPAINFIMDTVKYAGPNPCPPIVVGVGIGGTFEKAAMLAKKATLRPINTDNPDERYAALEKELLDEINKTGFGPAGLGGKYTALGVNIETFPTHIAGMPVAVNICCHAARHKETEI